MKSLSKQKTLRRDRRHGRIRARVSGTASRPRLSVFRSNKFIYAQLIDDERGVTIVAAASSAVGAGTQLERAREVGKAIALAAKGKGVSKAVFDRGGFIYTGKVRELAEGAREGGLEF